MLTIILSHFAESARISIVCGVESLVQLIKEIELIDSTDPASLSVSIFTFSLCRVTTPTLEPRGRRSVAGRNSALPSPELW